MVEPHPFAREKPKRKNAVIGLYDLPIYRDGAAWSGAIWLVLSIIIYTSTDPTGSSRWVTVPVGTTIMVTLFSIVPALIRRGFRKWRVGRRSASVATSGAPIAGPAPAWQQPGATPAAWPPPAAAATPVPSHTVTSSEAPAATWPPPPSPQRGVTPPMPGPTTGSSPSVAPTPPPPPPADRPPSASPRIQPLSGESATSGATLAAQRARMPHPVARAIRTLEVASNPREEYDAALRAAEVLTIVLGVSTVGAYRDAGAEPPEFSELRTAYLHQGVSQGHWLAAMYAVDKLVPRLGERLPGLASALRRGKKGSGLFSDLEAMIQERNRWAHGAGPRNVSDARARMDELRPLLLDALDRSAFMGDVPWILTRTTSYRRETQDFRVSALDATGDHPDFERRQFSSRAPLADDTFYMLAADGPRELSPFIVMHDCPECRQEEICYSDRLDPKYGVSLKSFARGHSMYEPDLNGELRQLFTVHPSA